MSTIQEKLFDFFEQEYKRMEEEALKDDAEEEVLQVSTGTDGTTTIVSTPSSPEETSSSEPSDEGSAKTTEIPENTFTLSLAEVVQEVSGEGKDQADPAEQEVKNPRILQDFGHHIGGARKDAVSMYQKEMEQAEGLQLVGKLTQDWPAPNYKKLLQVEGIDTWKIAAIRSLRDSCAAKPRRYQTTYWREDVANKRSLAVSIIKGEYSKDDFIETLTTLAHENERYTPGKAFSDLNYSDGHRYTYALHQFQLYDTIGHEKSLRHIYLWRRRDNGTLTVLASSSKDKVYANFESAIHCTDGTCYGIIRDGLHDIPDVIQAVSTYMDNKSQATSRTSHLSEKYGISYRYNDKSDKKELIYYIYRMAGKDNIAFAVADGFSSYTEASQYKEMHLEELEQKYTSMKEVPKEHNLKLLPRTGEKRVHEDVTPELFQDTFHLYGGEFGNWVEGKKRQDFLNNTYDSFLDLAEILHVEPKALALDGSLSLRFGSNGRGGRQAAKAHFEPLHKAINLTKKHGAGSLAHEWFHALDNYLGNLSGNMFLSQNKDISMLGFKIDSDRPRDEYYSNAMRRELQDGFAKALYAITSKTNVQSRSAKIDGAHSKVYWSDKVEMMARSFECYVIEKLKEKGIRNDFLASVKTEAQWKAEVGDAPIPYPYPTKEEMPAVIAGFDALFDNLKARENGENIAFFSCADHEHIGSMVEESNIISKHSYTAEERLLASFSENVLNLPIRFYEGPDALHGMYVPNEGIMYLNRKSDQDLSWTFYHEAFHAMKQEDPRLYEDLLSYTETEHIITKEQMDAYRIEHRAKNLTDEQVKEEMLANAFADKKTGQGILYQMTEKKPSLACRFMNYTKRLAQKAVAYFQGKTSSDSRLSAEQFQAFSDHLDFITENLTVHNEQPLARKSNVLGLDRLPITSEDKAVNPKGIHHPFYAQPDLQEAFDIRSATQMLKRFPKEIVQDVIASKSPLGKTPGYIKHIMQTAHNEQKLAAVR